MHALHLQRIYTHFGCAGLKTAWELGNYVPEFMVSLLLRQSNWQLFE